MDKIAKNFKLSTYLEKEVRHSFKTVLQNLSLELA